MPTLKPRKGSRENINNDKTRRGRSVMEKASSFHGYVNMAAAEKAAMRKHLLRPSTVPDLGFACGGSSEMEPSMMREGQRPRLTKLLLNVTIHGSSGTVQLVMRPESTVRDLISAAVREYVKEGRRPVLVTADPLCFNLHHSRFSLESLDREERLMELGSRNFFVCPKKPGMVLLISHAHGNDTVMASSSATTCSQEADIAAASCFDWLRFMDFLF